MDPNTLKLLMGSAGAGAVADKLYIENVFSTWLYTGNGSTQTIANGIDLSGKGGLVWIKNRGIVEDNRLQDTTRGVNQVLTSNSIAGQANATGINFSFLSDGFSQNNAFTDLNASGRSYVSWTFRKAAKFFDVVTYAGTGANRTVAHNLGSVPGTIIVKRTDTSADWQVYHRSLANTEYLVLNSVAAKATGATRWNSTTPTSTVFSLGTDTTVNASGGTYVAYIFAHDAGGFGDSGNDNVVSCASYTGNGSTTGPVVTLGWEPQWVLIKRSDATANWYLYDNIRGIAAGGNDSALIPNTTDAEAGGSNQIYLTSTGFGLETSNINFNASGGTYVYIAIRRGPMKTPTDATKVFKTNIRNGTGANASVTGIGFVPDLVATKTRTSSIQDNDAFWFDRLRGNFKYLISSVASAEGGTTGGFALAGTNQETASIVNLNNINRSGDTAVDWFFQRAPGFFDVVAYTGTGVARTVTHNLGVAPEIFFLKRRNLSSGWAAFVPDFSTGLYNQGKLEETDSFDRNVTYGTGQLNAAPTTTSFALTSNAIVNASGGTFIAYLFASCPGVSKVGSYTGTGTTLSVDCGFTNGARFVLIRRTDSTGDWYVWDTARGIVAGNDPFLLLNVNAAENTGTDYIDPLSSGFQISSTAPAAINANGGTYIYLSVA